MFKINGRGKFNKKGNWWYDKTNIEYFLTEKGKSLNKVIYDLVEFTLENNTQYYTEETILKTKEGFKNNYLIN